MSPIGWEFYGIKFSMFMTMLITVVAFLSVKLATRNEDHFVTVDRMAGDEGED